MKKTILSVASFLLLLSCDNSSNNNTLIQHGDKFFIVDSAEEVNSIKSTSYSNLPAGYSKRKYAEYVPQNDIEKRLLADYKLMEDATNKLDYKKVISMYYPDYFKYIQKQVPEKRISEIKAKCEKYLAQYLVENNQRYTKLWSEAKFAGLVITDIKNRVKEGNGLLYLYEYHTILYSETDTIFKDEAEYGVAASLNNGNSWHNTANNIDDDFKILSMSFSKNAIEKVLTKE